MLGYFCLVKQTTNNGSNSQACRRNLLNSEGPQKRNRSGSDGIQHEWQPIFGRSNRPSSIVSSVATAPVLYPSTTLDSASRADTVEKSFGGDRVAINRVNIQTSHLRSGYLNFPRHVKLQCLGILFRRQNVSD